MIETSSTHRTFQQDVAQAVEILKQEGCSEVYLFGSGATSNVLDDSDIDLAVRGCPPERFFRVFGMLLIELERSVDLIDLDAPNAFVQHLLNKEQIIRIV